MCMIEQCASLNTAYRRSFNKVEIRAGFQNDFNRLERWANRKDVKLKKGKGQVLHLGKNRSMSQSRLEAN